jgi:uncharacterized protein GlcG (DUF336 family)
MTSFDNSGSFVGTRKVLTLVGARNMAAMAEAEATKSGWRVVIAIVDDAGHVTYLQRADDVPSACIEVAIGKARTAAMFRQETKTMEAAVAGGRTAVITAPGAVTLEGGLPIMIDGQFIGGIGVSGVTAAQDAQVAKAGLQGLK